MSIVYNPKTREQKLGDRSETSAICTYLRLRALPTGETDLKSKPFRELFSVNGAATHARIGDKLLELRDNHLLTFQTFEHGGRMAYRIVLELLPEELPENALAVPKSYKDKLTDEQSIAQYFMRLENDKLGIMTTFTIKDYQNCKRLLKTNSKDVVKAAVKQFWEQKADQRKNPNFTEFYFDFARLANDVRDEREVEIATKLQKERDARPEETDREYLVREIKIQQKHDPAYAEQLQKELEALDAEEAD